MTTWLVTLTDADAGAVELDADEIATTPDGALALRTDDATVAVFAARTWANVVAAGAEIRRQLPPAPIAM